MSSAPALVSPAAWALIEPHYRPHAREILDKVIDFVLNECIPAEETFHAQVSTDPAKRWKSYPAVMEELKAKAKKRGLWNLFLSKQHYPDVGTDLTNLEYAVMCEVMGHAPRVAPEACNCSAPDTGNMEVLARYGTDEQKKKWLVPLLEGKIRSSFAMTEYGVASSDATNLKTSIRKDGDDVIVNGMKWWISGAGDPRNGIHILIGKHDFSPNADRHKSHTIVLIPSNHPGVKLIRPLTVLGYDDAPEGHYQVHYDNVRVPQSNIVAGWGRGFEVVQGRLGPGRIHHCMRAIGVAERALEHALMRVTAPERKTFGKQLFEHGSVVADLGHSRAEIDACRLLVLSAAIQIDRVRAKGAMKEIGIAKYFVPKTVSNVIDRAMQMHGAEGLSSDTPLAALFAGNRTLRLADGPDEVHVAQVGKAELKRAGALREHAQQVKKLAHEIAQRHGVASSKAKL